MEGRSSLARVATLALVGYICLVSNHVTTERGQPLPTVSTRRVASRAIVLSRHPQIRFLLKFGFWAMQVGYQPYQ